jgi:hypothetical protein
LIHYFLHSGVSSHGKSVSTIASRQAYITGEITVRKIVYGTCNIIWETLRCILMLKLMKVDAENRRVGSQALLPLMGNM